VCVYIYIYIYKSHVALLTDGITGQYNTKLA